MIIRLREPHVATELLSADEERRLANAIEVGVIAEAAGPDAITDAERSWLVAEGRAAWLRFVRANLGLVRTYSMPAAHRGQLAEADLFQEGCVALMLAIQRFDHRRGIKFSTYAVPWIRSAVTQAAAQRCGELDLPRRRVADLRQVRAAENALAVELGRLPTTAEVAAQLGRDPVWVDQLLVQGEPRARTDEESPQLADHDPTEDRLLSQLVVTGSGSPLLAVLPELQRQVLLLRCGFVGGRELSRREVAARLGLGRRRVRSLEETGLATLRRRLADRAA